MKEAAKDFFQRSDEKECIVTSDGNVYYPKHEHLAREHAREKGLTVHTFSREDVMPKKSTTETKETKSNSSSETKGSNTSKSSKSTKKNS